MHALGLVLYIRYGDLDCEIEAEVPASLKQRLARFAGDGAGCPAAPQRV